MRFGGYRLMPLPERFDLFLKYDYAETKDLCSKFLTLVFGPSGIFTHIF